MAKVVDADHGSPSSSSPSTSNSSGPTRRYKQPTKSGHTRDTKPRSRIEEVETNVDQLGSDPTQNPANVAYHPSEASPEGASGNPKCHDPDTVTFKDHSYPTKVKICGVGICTVQTGAVLALVVEMVACIALIGHGVYAWYQPKHLFEVDEPATKGTLAIIIPAEKMCAIIFDFAGPSVMLISIFIAYFGIALKRIKLLIPHAAMQLVFTLGLLLQCFVIVVTPMEYHAQLIGKARIFDNYIPGHVVPYHKGKLFGICFGILCAFAVGILIEIWFIEILKHYFFYMVVTTNAGGSAHASHCENEPHSKMSRNKGDNMDANLPASNNRKSKSKTGPREKSSGIEIISPGTYVNKAMDVSGQEMTVIHNQSDDDDLNHRGAQNPAFMPGDEIRVQRHPVGAEVHPQTDGRPDSHGRHQETARHVYRQQHVQSADEPPAKTTEFSSGRIALGEEPIVVTRQGDITKIVLDTPPSTPPSGRVTPEHDADTRDYEMKKVAERVETELEEPREKFRKDKSKERGERIKY